MKLLKKKPTNNGTRHQLNIEKSLLSKSHNVFRDKKRTIKSKAGRSTIDGHITAWHRGGGVKKLYRKLTLSNEVRKTIIINTEYDPFRSNFISTSFDLIRKKFHKAPATEGIFPGTLLTQTSAIEDLKLGYRTTLADIPAGSQIFNITNARSKEPKLIRSAGTFGVIVRKGPQKSSVKLPSGKIIELDSKEFATIGTAANANHNLTIVGKAGRKRLSGRRPIVRGIAMNPVDHPHGGRTNGGRPSVTPWGILTKSGFKLRKKKHD